MLITLRASTSIHKFQISILENKLRPYNRAQVLEFKIKHYFNGMTKAIIISPLWSLIIPPPLEPLREIEPSIFNLRKPKFVLSQ